MSLGDMNIRRMSLGLYLIQPGVEFLKYGRWLCSPSAGAHFRLQKRTVDNVLIDVSRVNNTLL